MVLPIGLVSGLDICLALDRFWPVHEQQAVDEHDYLGTLDDAYIIEGEKAKAENDSLAEVEKHNATTKIGEVNRRSFKYFDRPYWPTLNIELLGARFSL